MTLGRPWQWLWQPLDCGAKCLTPIKANDGRYNHPRLGRIWNSNILKTENLNWIIVTWQEVPCLKIRSWRFVFAIVHAGQNAHGLCAPCLFQDLSSNCRKNHGNNHETKIPHLFWFDLPSVVYFSMSNCPTVQQRCWGTDFQTVDTSLGWSFGLGDSPKQRRRLDPQRRTDLDEVWKWRCGSGETQRLGIQKCVFWC